MTTLIVALVASNILWIGLTIVAYQSGKIDGRWERWYEDHCRQYGYKRK